MQKIKHIDISDPPIFLGGMLGAMSIFIIASWSMTAVGDASNDVIKNVKLQLNEGRRGMPNYKSCIRIA